MHQAGQRGEQSEEHVCSVGISVVAQLHHPQSVCVYSTCRRAIRIIAVGVHARLVSSRLASSRTDVTGSHPLVAVNPSAQHPSPRHALDPEVTSRNDGGSAAAVW